MKIKQDTQEVYEGRIRKVLDYIDSHLSEYLNVQQLSDLGNFSMYHFHRIMRAHLCEPLMQYISRRRVEWAASLLITQDSPVSEIAVKVGFEEASSLNKAFKRHLGESPTVFRKKMRRLYLNNNQFKKEEVMKVVPVFITIKDTPVIFSEAIGMYQNSAAQAWEKVCGYAAPKGLMGPNTEFIGISLDDPNVTATDKLRYQACLTVEKALDADGAIGSKVIAGGKYAVFTHKGSYNNFQSIYNYIFGEWMQNSDQQVKDEMAFEKYLNSPDQVPEEELLTEIWVPLVG